MHRRLIAFAAVALAAAVALPASSVAQSGTKIGTLNCDISAGIGVIIASKKRVTCMFTPSNPGPREVYVGDISKFGLDLGATSGGEMVWAVFAPSDRRSARWPATMSAPPPRRPSAPASAPTRWLAATTAPSRCSRCRCRARPA